MTGSEAAPTGTVTFLFTDIEGSTKLAQQYPQDLPDLLARHHAILRRAIESYSGHIFQVVGDAFCVAFHSAEDALKAAIAAQRSLHDEPWEPAPVLVRMGIHTGSAELQGNGDYEGYLTLSRVQRLMAAAHGGQVLVSVATQQLVPREATDAIAWRDLGEGQLRDMFQHEHIYQLQIAGLPAEFPPIATLEASRHNLPAPVTSFVGREKEMAEIRQALHDHRMVTLTGSGGVGKTRLAVEVARRCVGQFAGGIWLAELAPVTNPTLVAEALLSIFNLREDNQRSALDRLIDHLREKAALLVLDNCEHLIQDCAQTCDAILRACSQVRILATSREHLAIDGEVAYRVASLGTSDVSPQAPVDELLRVDAVRLFVERAGAAKPGFRLTTENAPFVGQICARLDGIPLAIELAAARVKALSPAQIAARLDDRFRLLTQGSRTALPRQQTLRATIDWSYSLLSDPEKQLLRRLAVFAGGWTLEAAEAVCADPSGQEDVLDLLTHLVDKSLVSMEEAAHEMRYRRLETIRQYSLERLLESDEADTLRDRHLGYYVGFAELVDEKLKGAHQTTWQERMLAEVDNLRAALDWGLRRDPDSALRIVGAANLFWTAGGFSAEGFRWTQRALADAEQASLPQGYSADQRLLARARALRGLTRLYLSLGDNANAKRAAEESVAIYRRSQDARGLAFALVILAYPLEFLGERKEAEQALHESYTIARSEQDTYGMCRSLNRLARVVMSLYDDLALAEGYLQESIHLAREAGLRSQEAQAIETLGLIAGKRNDVDEARTRLQDALRIYEELGAKFNVILEKTNLAHLERQIGRHDAALDYYRETIVAFRDIGQSGAVAHQLECFGFIALAQGEAARALRLFAAASILRERSGTPMTPDEQVYFDAQLDGLRKSFDAREFGSIWSEARDMKVEQAIQLALE
ncbi:MAG: ATP-binding protein [Anaerolineae bacterium]